jgi:hypothetical protein
VNLYRAIRLVVSYQCTNLGKMFLSAGMKMNGKAGLHMVCLWGSASF